MTDPIQSNPTALVSNNSDGEIQSRSFHAHRNAGWLTWAGSPATSQGATPPVTTLTRGVTESSGSSHQQDFALSIIMSAIETAISADATDRTIGQFLNETSLGASVQDRTLAFSTGNTVSSAGTDSSNQSSSGSAVAPQANYVPFAGNEARYFPAAGTRLTVANKLQLQTYLDTYGIVNLDGGDYSTGGLSSITLRPGQQLTGLPNTTIVPPVTIQSGCHDALLKGVINTTVTFSGGAMSYQNCISMLKGCSVQAVDCQLESNLLISIVEGAIALNNPTTGYTRNTRIVRLQSHAGSAVFGGSDGIVNISSSVAGRQSWGNVVVVANHLTPIAPETNIAGQDDFSMVTFDCETVSDTTPSQASFKARNCTDIRLANWAGGMDYHAFFDIDATNVFTYCTRMLAKPNTPAVRWTYGPNVAAMADVFPIDDTASQLTDSNPTGLRAYSYGTSRPYRLRTTLPASVTGTDLTLANRLLRDNDAGKTYSRWGYYPARTVPDPGGVNWNVGLAGKTDSTASLQAILDASYTAAGGSGNPVEAVFPAGQYYTSSPLVVHFNQTVRGAGSDVCSITAKSSGFALFISDGSQGPMGIVDITGQGADSFFMAQQAGVQQTQVNFSHCVMRNMNLGGIYLNNCYAWDNCWVEFCDFVNCAVGVLTRGTGTGEGPNVSYMDKVTYYRCQFIGCTAASDMAPARPNNSVVWLESYFSGCGDNALRGGAGHNTEAFVNCQFTGTTGTTVLNVNSPTLVVGCKFTLNSSNSYVVPDLVYFEGCEFSRASGTGVIYQYDNPRDPRDARENGMVNCKTTDTPIGNMFNTAGNTLTIINCELAPIDVSNGWQQLWGGVQWDTMGTPYTGDDVYNAQPNWMTGTPVGGSRFLRNRLT